jgi:Flp pilus assembly protein TadG
MIRLERLRRSRNGTAALEFALCLPLLLMLTGGIADFGLLWDARGHLATAVNAGTEEALLAGTSATQTGVQAVMTAASGLTGATYSATALGCYCSSTSGTTVTLSSATCGTTCSSGYTAGYYMTLTATYTYTPIMPTFSHLTTTSHTETATVRVR